MTIETNTNDRLLTEVERQEKYLAKLPEDFSFPLFNAAQALESQRRSGYRNTAAAAREIVDNAIEAKATRIDVCFERPKALKLHQRADSIYSMAFIDNGSGMLPKMARYALSWGSGTHFDDPAFIGKFGFGLPNASINQTKLVEVYTKTADASTISRAVLDVRLIKAHGLQSIDAPEEGVALPEFVQAYLDKQGLAFEHGTVVVWAEPDRLTYRTPALMKEHLLDDFGVTYRYLLQNVDLYVDKTKVLPVDPLFLTPAARYFLPQDKGGSEMSADYNMPVRYTLDAETGSFALSKVEDLSELDRDDPNLLAAGAIYVRVARFPYGFAEDPRKVANASSEAQRRFEVRKTRRGMSFVRAGREIETVDVFPKSVKDQAKGLGNWPLLQSYAYHWGVEVRFDPDLDEVFGITNDKQTVRPIEDLWKLFASEEIDKQLSREQMHQRKIRKDERDRQKQALAEKSEEVTPAESAAAAADSMTGQKPRIPERSAAKARKDFNTAAAEHAKVNQTSIDAARKALDEAAKRRPYVVDFYDEPRGPFYKPERSNGSQIVVRINRAHSFFQTLYSPLLSLTGGAQAKQALDVLLIALARSELVVENEETAAWYLTQRERAWSEFLADAYRSLQQKMAPVDEESAEPGETSNEGAGDVVELQAAE
jgi:hypothetical protein